MNEDRDLNRLLDAWLAEGPVQAADRVIDSVADRIGRQRQQPAWRVSRRDSHVNAHLKPLLAVAAVIVIVVGGLAVLGRPSGSNVGGPASPAASPSAVASASPSASASPTAAPSASPVYPAWYTDERTGAGTLPAGSQSTSAFVPGFTFTVPEGWVNSGDEVGFYGLFPDTPANAAEFAASENLAHAIHMGPQADPYFTCDAWEDNRGGTAAEMVAAIVANEALATSVPVDVTIGGLTGKQVDVQLDPTWTERCPGDPPGFDLADGRTRGILLDTPDGRVIVILVGSQHSDGHEAFLAEAMQIIDSFEFDTGQ